MNVQDWDTQNDSRINTAKKAITQILSSIPHRFWLTIFSGNSQRILPHTSDTWLFLTLLQWLDRKNVSQWGSNILWAIENSLYNFLDNNSGNIIIFTDGWDKNYKNTKELYKKIKEKNIQLFIIWVGTEKWWYIPYWIDHFWRNIYKIYRWKKVISSLNKNNLKSLASKLWGKYIHISDLKNFNIFKTKNIWKNFFFWKIWKVWFFIFIAFIFWIYFILHIFVYKYFFSLKIWK